MKNLFFSFIVLLSIRASAQIKPNRYTTNTDPVAISLTPQIVSRGSNTQLTLKLFGTNSGGGVQFNRAFLNFENTNVNQAGFHVMVSRETYTLGTPSGRWEPK